MLQMKKLVWALTFCLFTLPVQLVFAQDSNNIFVSPTDKYINKGDDFIITVNISSSNIFAAGFELYFNNTILEALSVEEDDLLSEGKINSTYCFMTKHFPNQFQGKKCYGIDNTNGKISFVNTRLGNTSASGSGALAEIKFKANSNGMGSLDLQNVKTLKSINSNIEEITNLSISDGNIYIGSLRIFNISLKQGWNLISIPLELENNSINYIFNNTNITIYSYKNNSFFIPNEIDNKLGYWLKINETKNITLIGTEIKNKRIELTNDWNLISYPYLTEIDINNSDLKNYTTFTYVNNSWLSYNPNRINSLNTLKKLIHGYGYWVRK